MLGERCRKSTDYSDMMNDSMGMEQLPPSGDLVLSVSQTDQPKDTANAALNKLGNVSTTSLLIVNIYGICTLCPADATRKTLDAGFCALRHMGARTTCDAFALIMAPCMMRTCVSKIVVLTFRASKDVAFWACAVS